MGRELSKAAHGVVDIYGELSKERLSHLVNITSRCYARALKLRLDAHDLPLGYWAILRTLWNEDGLTQRVLSERASLTPPTAHTVLKAMEAIGYVRREQREGNRKNLHVYLTPTGRRLMKALIPPALEVNDVAVAGISSADLKILQRTLHRMIENLCRDRGLAGAATGRSKTRKGARPA